MAAEWRAAHPNRRLAPVIRSKLGLITGVDLRTGDHAASGGVITGANLQMARSVRRSESQRPRMARLAPFMEGIGPFGIGSRGRTASSAFSRCLTSVIWIGLTALGDFFR